MSAGMALDVLLGGIADPGRLGALRVSGLALDSRRVLPGEAFVALRGLHHHGIEFAAAARARGAGVILAQAPPPAGVAPTHDCLWITDLDRHLGRLAARLWGDPGRALRPLAVTGTNGKTSVVQLLARALTALGQPCATIGTLGSGVPDHLVPGDHTTPDAITVQQLLAGFRAAGQQRVAMEVSSHALVQGRVEAVPFRGAVFTNLSRDHLDYHGSMDAYFAAKARLFAWPTLQAAAINVDDPRGRELLGRVAPTVECISYGMLDPSAAVRASAVRSHAAGSDFQLHTPWGEAAVTTRLLGDFNVLNLLAVVAILGGEGWPFAAVRDLLPALAPIRGRMQQVAAPGVGQPLVVVDYAHTPAALAAALRNLRGHTRGRLLCVFGAGGDRDRGKRPQMGRVVEQAADCLIITDDNPRSEDGAAIIADIVAGLERPGGASIERDRRAAINAAIKGAGSGDTVLIAGKGHETTQEDGAGRHPFDDAAVARAALAGDVPTLFAEAP